MQNIRPRSISATELKHWLIGTGESPVLVDVREQQELDLAPFPGPVLHWPLSQSQAWLDRVPGQLADGPPVVVLCHAGVRSFHFGLWLLEQIPGLEVWNLEGGIDAWSVQVDPTVPRY